MSKIPFGVSPPPEHALRNGRADGCTCDSVIEMLRACVTKLENQLDPTGRTGRTMEAARKSVEREKQICADGAAAERARIVAWLNSGGGSVSAGAHDHAVLFAKRIADCAHLPGAGKG